MDEIFNSHFIVNFAQNMPVEIILKIVYEMMPHMSLILISYLHAAQIHCFSWHMMFHKLSVYEFLKIGQNLLKLWTKVCWLFVRFFE